VNLILLRALTPRHASKKLLDFIQYFWKFLVKVDSDLVAQLYLERPDYDRTKSVLKKAWEHFSSC